MTSKTTFYVGIFLLIIAIIMLIVLITYQSSISGTEGGCCGSDLIVSCANSPAQIITEIIYSIILIIAIYMIVSYVQQGNDLKKLYQAKTKKLFPAKVEKVERKSRKIIIEESESDYSE